MRQKFHSPAFPLFAGIACLALAAIGVIAAPSLTGLALMIGIAGLLWERYRLIRALRNLISHLQRNDLDAKLEIGAGVWGEVCRAVNRLFQQRRIEHHLHHLLPDQPAFRQIDPLAIHPPASGWTRTVAVLAVGQLPISDPLDELRARMHLVRDPAARQQAVIQWHDGHLLLIFGALIPDSEPLRAALDAAMAISATAQSDGLSIPAFALSSGQCRIAVVPILGLHLLGEPLSEAALFLKQTPPATLTCSDEAYLQLRSLGRLPPTRLFTRRHILSIGDIQAA